MDTLLAHLHNGSTSVAILLPTAIMLGALHGLEPGHSKTMMAAFIIAVRGTIRQAVLLGLAATVSHTAIVWLIALGGLWLFGGLNAEHTEPYFQMASGAAICLMALWMLARVWRDHRHDHKNDHHHDHDHDHDHDHGHHHDHTPPAASVLELEADGPLDAHAAAHARDIRRRFSHGHASTAQIILFGLTGGLVPCAGAVTVLLLCLQLQRLVLGGILVLGFSLGLALTLVASGVIAALGARQVARRWKGFGQLVHYAPLASGAVIGVIGLCVLLQGWIAMPQ